MRARAVVVACLQLKAVQLLRITADIPTHLPCEPARGTKRHGSIPGPFCTCQPHSTLYGGRFCVLACCSLRTSPLHLQDAAIAKRSAVRNFLMHGFHLLVMMVVGHQIRDTQCGFKVWAVTR